MAFVFVQVRLQISYTHLLPFTAPERSDKPVNGDRASLFPLMPYFTSICLFVFSGVQAKAKKACFCEFALFGVNWPSLPLG